MCIQREWNADILQKFNLNYLLLNWSIFKRNGKQYEKTARWNIWNLLCTLLYKLLVCKISYSSVCTIYLKIDSIYNECSGRQVDLKLLIIYSMWCCDILLAPSSLNPNPHFSTSFISQTMQSTFHSTAFHSSVSGMSSFLLCR